VTKSRYREVWDLKLSEACKADMGRPQNHDLWTLRRACRPSAAIRTSKLAESSRLVSVPGTRGLAPPPHDTKSSAALPRQPSDARSNGLAVPRRGRPFRTTRRKETANEEDHRPQGRRRPFDYGFGVVLLPGTRRLMSQPGCFGVRLTAREKHLRPGFGVLLHRARAGQILPTSRDV
jgi:hypothetical protein